MSSASMNQEVCGMRSNVSEMERCLEEALAEYHVAADAGDLPDREAFLEKYSAVREELARFLDSFDLIRALSFEVQECVSADDAPLPNHAPLGDFRMVREIGRGGMGVVFEAEQLSMGRRMALKVLPFASLLDQQQLTRFKNEARAAGTLEHPNIVAVHSVGEERGIHYYAMQLVRGKNLAEVIEELRETKQQSPEMRAENLDTDREESASRDAVVDFPSDTVAAALPTLRTASPQESFRQAALLIADAADALHYAHNQGVIHRDIKPANLLVDNQSRIYVTDFGLARLETADNVTLTGDVLGTLRYMSPEQAAGKPGLVDYRTDIHALGATLYELLALRPAFNSTDRAELLSRITNDSPPLLRQFDPRIPADLATIVHKTMEKDPADRYESAAALADDLRAFAEHRAIMAKPPSLATRTTKWARRHIAAVGTALLLMILAVIGVTIGALMIGQERSIALQNAQDAQRSAEESQDNYDLALAALEATLAESVVGDLIVEPVDIKRKELQRRGIEFYEQLAQRNHVAAITWPAYRLLRFNQEHEKAIDLIQQDPDSGIQAYQDAIALAEELVAATNGAPEHQARLIHVIDDFGLRLSDLGQLNEAMQQSLLAERVTDELVQRHPDHPLNPFIQGKVLYNRSVCHLMLGDMDESEQTCRAALAHLEKISPQQREASPYGKVHIKTIAMCRYNLGMYAAQRDKPDEAQSLWNDSLLDWRVLTLLDPFSSEYQSRVGATLSNLAVLARDRGDYAQCRRLAEEALQYQRRALKTRPIYAAAHEFLQKHHQHLTEALRQLGEHQDLADVAQQRAEELSHVNDEVAQAAMSLAECAELVHNDKRLTRETRQAMAAEYAIRAFQVMDNFRRRAKDEKDLGYVAASYYAAAAHFDTAEQPANARRAWQTALDVFKSLRGAKTYEDADERILAHQKSGDPEYEGESTLDEIIEELQLTLERGK